MKHRFERIVQRSTASALSKSEDGNSSDDSGFVVSDGVVEEEEDDHHESDFSDYFCHRAFDVEREIKTQRPTFGGGIL